MGPSTSLLQAVVYLAMLGVLLVVFRGEIFQDFLDLLLPRRGLQ